MARCQTGFRYLLRSAKAAPWTCFRNQSVGSPIYQPHLSSGFPRHKTRTGSVYDLDFADNVFYPDWDVRGSLALKIKNDESSVLELEINCKKTEIQASDIIDNISTGGIVSGHKMEMVDCFFYLDS